MRFARWRAGARASRHLIKKSARELRQGGSDYRCCIPALAGFVSPQSTVPDGSQIFQHDRHRAIAFLNENELCALTGQDVSVSIEIVKWLALFLLIVLQCSCTTLVNRRDLYSPEPAPDSREAVRQMTTVTTTTTMRREAPPPAGY